MLKRQLFIAAVFVALIVALLPSAFAGKPFDCLPRNLAGTGGWAITYSPTKGDFAAWRCPSGQLGMFACPRAKCSLRGTQKMAAAFISAPNLTTLNTAVGGFDDPWTNPAYTVIWKPYAAEINALKP